MLHLVLFRIELLKLHLPPHQAHRDSLERFPKSQIRLSWKNKKGKNMRNKTIGDLMGKSKVLDLFV